MGHSFRTYLAGKTLLTCRSCNNHLAVGESILSDHFTGQHGKALLIRHAVNTYTGDPEERVMRTGRHTVRDLFCEVCHTVLGWKYDFAHDPDQKYKEGRFILERALITERPEQRESYSVRPIISESPRDLLLRV